MKGRLINAFTEGFKNSFRLAVSLVTSVATTISAFAHEGSADRQMESNKVQAPRDKKSRGR